MNDEKKLDTLLAELGRATDLDAPRGLEERLRAHVGRTRAAQAETTARVRNVWLVAAAVAAVVGVAATLATRQPRSLASTTRENPAFAPAPSTMVRPSPVVASPVLARAHPDATARRPASVPPRRLPARRTAAPPSRSPEATNFIALPGAPALAEADSLHLVRVSLPPSALAAWGWTPSLDEMRPLQADVIVGHDGLARAIRLVAAEDSGRGRR